MRVFLEIFKEQSEEESEKGVPREEIRVDVSDLGESEIVRKRDEIVAMLGWKNFKSQIHYCYHDEAQVRPCEIREI